MKVHNADIAEKFNELADLLEILAENPFRIRAYRNAARLIGSLSHEATDLIKKNEDLTRFPGIGKDLAEKIITIVKTGELPLLKQTRKKVPRALSEMMRIPDLGPKRVKILYDKLKIRSISDLKKAIKQGKIAKLEGFGEKTQEKIASALKKFKTGEKKRLKLVDAEKIADSLVKFLKKIDGVKEVIVAGSFRRRKETVGDLDILVTTSKNSHVMERLLKYDGIKKVISQGETRATVELHSGLQVDMRVVPQESYGAALLYFTGSQAHNIEVRKLAQQKNLKINEYGVFKGEKCIAGKTETEVYKCVNLPYIEPELRENRGEILAAQTNKLPKLITLKDIKGDLHCHTSIGDGQDSIEEMARKAQKLGYQYLAVTEHSKRLTIANGLNEKQLLQQIKKIDKLNLKFKNFRILKSIECDILEDGKLDLSDNVLKELDFVIGAIHSKFKLPSTKQTERILRAMDNKYFNILAHPTGRLINQRDAYEIDLEKIMRVAKKCGCFMELNAQPDRLDLNDVHCKMAKEIGIKVAIATDAHSAVTLEYMRYGIDQARRGWLSAADVLNTRPWRELQKLLQRK
jgi:DNA polymerase (family 10)